MNTPMSAGVSVVITSAVRTPIGNFLGSLQSLEAHELGAVAAKEALSRSSVEPEELSEVIVGQLLPAGKGPNTGRRAAVLAGIPFEVPAYTINMQCGSSMKALWLAFQSIRNGDSEIVLCGGQESMSRAEHSALLRIPQRNGPVAMEDTLYKDCLKCPFSQDVLMMTAEHVAKIHNISREDQDAFAAESQRRTKTAKESGVLDAEIIPVPVTKPASAKNNKSKPRGDNGEPVTMVRDDEFPKPDTTQSILSKLRPAILHDGTGTVTAGNSSGVNDGAAFCVLMRLDEAERRGLQPLGKIVSFGQVGLDPKVMGMGPVEAIKRAVEKAGWTMDCVELFEINEAFAAQTVAVIKELNIDMAICNVNGGAIAWGHPVGAAGARIVTTLLHSMKARKVCKGVASLCVGGGMGIAMCLERAPEWN